jgi:hypothetical protein
MNGILSYPETASEFSLVDLLSGEILEFLLEFLFEGGLELLMWLLGAL